jgi:hypothetical protein
MTRYERSNFHPINVTPAMPMGLRHGFDVDAFEAMLVILAADEERDV